MPRHPEAGHPDILVHGRAHGADHPAVPAAAADLPAHRLRRFAVPELVPRLLVQVAHDLLLPGAVAGHHITVRVNEKGIEAHVAGQKPLLAVYVVDKAVVEVGPEPLFGAPGSEQLIHQGLKVCRHHGPVVDDIAALHKVKAVVQGGGGEFHTHLVGDPVQGHQVGGVPVLDRHAEAHVLHAHFPELLQGGIAPVEAILQTPDGVVGILQALDGDPDAHLGEFPAQVDDPVREKAVGGDHDPVAFFVQLPDDVLQVLPEKGLAAGDVGKIHLRELADGLQGYFLLWSGGGLVSAAHIAPGVAAVGHNHGAVKFFGHYNTSLLFNSIYLPESYLSMPHAWY